MSDELEGFDVDALPDTERGPLSEGTREQQIQDLQGIVDARKDWTPEQRAEEIAEWQKFGGDAEAMWAQDEARLAALKAGEDVD